MLFSPQLVTRFSYLLRPLFRPQNPPQNPQRIIVLKPCCLGDVVQATAVVAALKHSYPEARLDFAVGSWSRAVLSNNPHLSHLIDTGRVGQGFNGNPDHNPTARGITTPGRFPFHFLGSHLQLPRTKRGHDEQTPRV